VLVGGGLVARIGRPGMSVLMKDDLWRRWRAGESISVISRGIGKPPGSVFTVLKHYGGIAPTVGKPSGLHLSQEDREEISRGLGAQETLAAIDASLGRPTSTVSRKVARNCGRAAYRSVGAGEHSREQSLRPKPSALKHNAMLRRVVIGFLEQDWSPQQIVRRLHPDEESMKISHESIYRAIYVTRWKVIPRELCQKLGTGRSIGKNKKNVVKGRCSQIKDARPIGERPALADERATLGHLEGDLIIGSKNSQVATPVDRKSRFLILVALRSRHTATAIPPLTRAYSHMDKRLRGTLTWDRRDGTCRPPTARRRRRHRRLLRCPSQSVAVRHQRKHEQANPAGPSQEKSTLASAAKPISTPWRGDSITDHANDSTTPPRPSPLR